MIEMENPTDPTPHSTIDNTKDVPLHVVLQLKQNFEDIKKTQQNVTELIDGIIDNLDSAETIMKDLDVHPIVTELKKDMVQFLQENIKDVEARVVGLMSKSNSFEGSFDTTLKETPNDSFANVKMKSEIEKFDPSPFVSMKLTKHVKKFPCKIVGVVDTVHLIVEPIIEEFIDKFNKMEAEIKRYGPILKAISNPKENQACIALCSDDFSYYRALIRDGNYSEDEVEVIFPDYLNVDVIERKYVKHCPGELVQEPLRHLIVRLDGVQPNESVQSDVIRYLNEYIDREAIAVIVENDAIPSVHLYDNEQQKVLLINH